MTKNNEADNKIDISNKCMAFEIIATIMLHNKTITQQEYERVLRYNSKLMKQGKNKSCSLL